MKHTRQGEKRKQITNESRSKPVRCIETGIIYYGAVGASKQTGIDKTGIQKCCNGKQNIAGGYHWEYVDNVSKDDISYEITVTSDEKNKYRQKKPVKCIETGKIYESITSAGKETRANSSKISDVCRGKRKTAGGYHWEYVEEPTH